MREFTRAAQDVAERQEDWIEFAVNGPGPDDRVVCRARRVPSDGQVAYLMARNTPHTPLPQRVSSMLNFFDAVMDRESAMHVSERLLSGEDPFGLEDVTAIIEYLMEEWSGRPTQPAPVSTVSQTSAGPSSMPTTETSTSSGYPQPGSATSSTPGYTNVPPPPVF